MENHFKDLTEHLCPDELEGLAMELHGKAKDIRESELEAKEQAEALKKEEEAFNKKVATFDKSLAKYDGLIAEGEKQLEDLQESRVKSKSSASDKVYSDADLEKSKGGFWEGIIKKPMKDFQFAHLDANIEKFEGSLERLKATRDKISQERGLLTSVYNEKQRARKTANDTQTERNLQVEACNRVGLIARSYKLAEDSIGRLKELVYLIQTPQFEQHLHRLGVDNHAALTQLFGGVFSKGRIDQLTFRELIEYLSQYNLIGDKETAEHYARIAERDISKPHIPEQYPVMENVAF